MLNEPSLKLLIHIIFSYTEQELGNQLLLITMQPIELTLIVAATRSMGIGAKGSLPWTGLKKEMAYFARVTKRLPPQVRSAL
jgi:hypothetical protein